VPGSKLKIYRTFDLNKPIESFAVKHKTKNWQCTRFGDGGLGFGVRVQCLGNVVLHGNLFKEAYSCRNFIRNYINKSKMENKNFCSKIYRLMMKGKIDFTPKV